MKRRAIALGAAATVAAVALVFAVGRELVDAVIGPENVIVGMLKSMEADASRVPNVAGEGWTQLTVRYDRIAVIRRSPKLFEVSATVDVEGQWNSISVSVVGVERVPFEEGAQGWRPRDGYLPRVTTLLHALDAQHRRRSGERLLRWAARLEKESATIREEYLHEEDTPERPVKREEARVFGARIEGGQFVFTEG